MHHSAVSAIPSNKRIIRNEVHNLKRKFGFTDISYFPILEFIELILPIIDEEFHIDVVPNKYFKDRYAEALPSLHMIRVSKYVYEGARRGNRKYRVIMAHELGHYLMHDDRNICYAKLKEGYRRYDVEYQADVFASELLIPYEFAKKHSPELIAKYCGVPQKIASDYKKSIAKDVQANKQRAHRAKRKRKASTRKRNTGESYS